MAKKDFDLEGRLTRGVGLGSGLCMDSCGGTSKGTGIAYGVPPMGGAGSQCTVEVMRDKCDTWLMLLLVPVATLDAV